MATKPKQLLLWGSALLVFCMAYLQWAYNDIPFSVKTIRGDRILARQVLGLKNLVFIHSDEQQLLFVDGKRYVNLRGNLPFFLEVPGKHSVVFVTSKGLKMADSVLHYHDFDTGKTVDFSCAEFTFGSGIKHKADGDRVMDIVVGLDGDRLTLESAAGPVKGTIALDIATGKLIFVKYWKNGLEVNPASRP